MKVFNSLNAQFGINETINTVHNGFTGGAFVTKIYLKNEEKDKYFSGIVVKVTMGNGELVENSIFSTTGWSVKLLSQDTEPTELEWSRVSINTELEIDDFGTELQADTSTVRTVWIRVFCPGHTAPQIKENINLIIDYTESAIGS